LKLLSWVVETSFCQEESRFGIYISRAYFFSAKLWTSRQQSSQQAFVTNALGYQFPILSGVNFGISD
jgi:hypothetical protein